MKEQPKEQHTNTGKRQVNIIEDIGMGISRESLAAKPKQKENEHDDEK